MEATSRNQAETVTINDPSLVVRKLEEMIETADRKNDDVTLTINGVLVEIAPDQGTTLDDLKRSYFCKQAGLTLKNGIVFPGKDDTPLSFAEKLLRVAKTAGIYVRGEIEGLPLEVLQGSTQTAAEVVRSGERNRRAKEIRGEKEGGLLRDIVERTDKTREDLFRNLSSEQADRLRIRKVERDLKNVDFGDWNSVMDWMYKFVGVTHNGELAYDHERIFKTFQEHGFETDPANHYLPEVNASVREAMVIVANILSYVRDKGIFNQFTSEIVGRWVNANQGRSIPRS